MLGDGLNLPSNIGPFDRIIVTAAVERIPENLIERLEVGGILIAPVGPHQGVQTLTRLSRTDRRDRAQGTRRGPLRARTARRGAGAVELRISCAANVLLGGLSRYLLGACLLKTPVLLRTSE